jgi:hypothetical protein
MNLANEENVELTDEQLEFLASGGCSVDQYDRCPELKFRNKLG